MRKSWSKPLAVALAIAALVGAWFVFPREKARRDESVVIGEDESEEIAKSDYIVEVEPEIPESLSEALSGETPSEAAAAEFDDLVDEWREPRTEAIDEVAVAKFAKTFEGLAEDDREAGLQRALNLIPDDNILVLSGILFGETGDETAKTMIFHDILNRDEAVKLPILEEIRKNRSHPCFEDADWVLESTAD